MAIISPRPATFRLLPVRSWCSRGARTGDWSQGGHLQSVTDPGGGQVAASTALGCFKATKNPCPCQQPPASKELMLPRRQTPTPAAAHGGFLPQQIETVNIDSLFFQGFLMPSDTQKLLSAPIITNLRSKCVLMGRRAALAPTNHF